MSNEEKTKKDKKKEKKQEKKASKELKELKKDFEKLSEQNQQLEEEKSQIYEKLQRLSADYANYQKRIPKQIEDNVRFEKEKIIKAVLPALDNFEHTLANIEQTENEEIYKGVRIIYDQMLDVLKSFGTEQITAEGETFDPNRHQAMMQRNESDKEDNLVLQEFQKGYTLNGRVIRPSKVVVNKLQTCGDPQQKPQDEDSSNNQTDDNDNQE
jgi:molecular chaperone GrpE